MEKKFVVYSISTNGVVFYIGRTCNFKRRKNEHLRESHKKYNTYKVNKIKKLQELGEPIEFNKLHEDLSYEESVSLEIEEVKKHKEMGCKLTNLTEGGEGLYGISRTFSDEWKENLKIAKKKQYDNGYVSKLKGRSKLDIIGDENKIKEINEKTSKTRKEKGIIPINVGKKLEDIVSEERACEIKKICSETAKKTFTGTKQSEGHINKRIESMTNTLKTRTEEEKNRISEINRNNAEKSIKRFKFLINEKYEFYGTWKSLSQDIFKILGIKVDPQSLSSFYKGITKKLKCDIFKIEIIS